MGLKLGMVQLPAVEGDVVGNCVKIERWIESCREKNFDILCFPELCISGYEFESAAALDEAEFMAGLAKKYKQALIAGIHSVHGREHYNSVCFWDENGNLLKEYKKIHLWAAENDFFARGNELAAVDYHGWRIGLMMCADLGFAEISTPLALNEGVDVIICPSAWGEGPELFANCAKIRAAENQVFVAALNRASGSEHYCGSSTVANPDGTTLCRISSSEEALISATLEKEKLEKAKEFLPWRKMKQNEIYKKIRKGYE